VTVYTFFVRDERIAHPSEARTTETICQSKHDHRRFVKYLVLKDDECKDQRTILRLYQMSSVDHQIDSLSLFNPGASRLLRRSTLLAVAARQCVQMKAWNIANLVSRRRGSRWKRLYYPRLKQIQQMSLGPPECFVKRRYRQEP
jgi:hypothetical protein